MHFIQLHFRFVLFIGVFSLLLGFALTYLYKTITTKNNYSINFKKKFRTTLTIFYLIFLLSFFITRLYKIHIFSFSAQVYFWGVYSIFGMIGVLIIYFLFFDIPFYTAQYLFKNKMNPDRRNFIKKIGNTGVLGLASVSVGTGLRTALKGPEIVKVEIPIQKSEAGFLKGLKIIQISDLHVGPLIHKEYVENVVRLTMSEKPDLIFLTGDLVDGTVEEIRPHLEPIKKLQAKYGVYGCTGNHEFFSGVYDWLKAFPEFGITMLNNEHKIITVNDKQFALAGIYDRSAYRMTWDLKSDPFVAAKNIPNNIPYKIILAHQPASVFECTEAGFDLQFSGHTHAGQFFPFSLVVKFFHPYVKGLHFHDRKMWIYVNRATGFWGPPNRFGISSEITSITLT